MKIKFPYMVKFAGKYFPANTTINITNSDFGTLKNLPNMVVVEENTTQEAKKEQIKEPAKQPKAKKTTKKTAKKGG